MPVTLHTGLPGGGKTLYTIDHVRKLAERENRPVYYLGIPDLALPWTELAPDALDKLHELPPGALVVIDECQRYYAPRPAGSRVSERLRYYETHRHHGHDVYLITQHPRLLDSHIRALVETHRHLIRYWGKERARVWEWNEVNDNPQRKRGAEYGQSQMWAYPRDVYALYKSTTQNTIQPRFPWRVLILPVVLGAVCITAFYWWYQGALPDMPTDSAVMAGPGAGAAVPASAPGSILPGPIHRPAAERVPVPVDPRSVALAHAPALRGLPGTAAMYWESYSEIRDYPRVVGCVADEVQCRCYTQQATRADIDPQQCQRIAYQGPSFDHSRPDPRQRSRDDDRTGNRERSRGEPMTGVDLMHARDAEYSGSMTELSRVRR